MAPPLIDSFRNVATSLSTTVPVPATVGSVP
jgi:hypothetical protein